MPEGAEKDGAENTRMKIFQICRGNKKVNLQFQKDQ